MDSLTLTGSVSAITGVNDGGANYVSWNQQVLRIYPFGAGGASSDCGLTDASGNPVAYFVVKASGAAAVGATLHGGGTLVGDLPLTWEPLGFFWAGFVGIAFAMIVRRGLGRLPRLFRGPFRE